MVLPNPLVFRKRRIAQFLIVAILIVLNLGVLGVPSRAHAQTTTLGAASLTPGPSGPLVATDPPIRDVEDTSHDEPKAYVRLTEYAWAFDPLEEMDSTSDYYLVFISAAVQAKDGWCLADGRFTTPGGYNPPSQAVRVEMNNGKIMTDKVSPLTGAHGDQIGTLDLSVGLSLGVKDGPIEAGVSAGISWSQILWQYTTKVTSLNSTQVAWETTIAKPAWPDPIPNPLLPLSCNEEAWAWGYAFGVSVAEGQTPVVDVSMTGVFFTYHPFNPVADIKGFTVYSGAGNSDSCPDKGDAICPHSLALPPAVSFETNPLVGSIIFNDTEFAHNQHAFYRPETYSAAATPVDGYIFDHWEQGGGVKPIDSGCSPSTFDRCNPGVFNVTGNGFLRAIFAAKITFYTNPPDVGSISIDSCDNPGHTNGDFVYHWMSLPPEFGRYEVVCTHAPAGYQFDHWSATGALFPGPYPNQNPFNSTDVQITGPTSITAWFSPKTCCPGVIFNTNLNNNGGPALIGGSILIGTQDVTNSRLYFAKGSIIEPLAVPSEGYVFDHWDISGLSLALQDTECGPRCGYVGNNGSNPGLFNVTGTCCWYVTAHFTLKVTFETNPPGTGSISWGGCGPNHPGHQDGDWVLANPSLALYPLNTQTICANTPAGYKFDHWTTTSPITGNLERLVFAPYNSTTQVVIWMTPFVIKAWFTSLSNNTSTAPSVPSAPSSLAATGQYGRADLAWNAPFSDGGSPVTGYKVYRGNSFVGVSFLASIGNQLWYQDTSVSNGQVYYYRITAVNSVGEGPSSNTDSARPGIDRITIAPDPRSVLTEAQVQFSAFARAESGEIVQGVSFSWTTSVPGASITSAGLFKAGTIIGTFTEEVSVSAAGVNGYATVIVQAPPGARASTASLPLDSLGLWTWALIPGAVAAAIGVLAVVVYLKKINRRLSRRP